ncbi:MAG: L-aspartate oxidase [Rhizomicrobium sp.]
MSAEAGTVVEAEGAVIVGAGIAGLFTALSLAPFPALIVAAERPGVSGSSAWAQGGIAAALGKGDSWSSHAEDTLRAGGGLCDSEVARFVAQEAPQRIEDLLRLGAPLDRNADGSLALAREAAHSRSRIVHVSGDRTGAAITQTLARAACTTSSITVLDGMQALELAWSDEGIIGVFARRGTDADAQIVFIRSRRVILATGGVGALFAATTNPSGSRGEGVGMAARAGARIADPEFVQFHPTAIALGRDPAPLATEALRGEGATLVDESGRRFMLSVHPAAELAPRDLVARAIHREILSGHRIFLDCRIAVGERFASHFPTVDAVCRSAGIDAASQPIPVAPAAHYHMGGIASDHHGRSSLEGLWVVGEAAGTGLHGANRLASNSLAEALVFGARVASDVRSRTEQTVRRVAEPHPPSAAKPETLAQSFRQAMTRGAGLERDADGLTALLATIVRSEGAVRDPALLNAMTAAKLIVAGALVREESVGAHWRRDYPDAGATPARGVLTLADADRIAQKYDANVRSARSTVT